MTANVNRLEYKSAKGGMLLFPVFRLAQISVPLAFISGFLRMESPQEYDACTPLRFFLVIHGIIDRR